MALSVHQNKSKKHDSSLECEPNRMLVEALEDEAK